MTSYVYIGYDASTHMAKIGQTKQKPQERARAIRKATDKHFQLLSYKSMTELNTYATMSIAVEGHMRHKLEVAGFEVQGNDHFHCDSHMLNSFIAIAKEAADNYLHMENWGCADWV